MEINVVCPLCLSQNVLLANSKQSNNYFVCPSCKGSFSSRVVKIRSKNSRGNKKENKRTFSIRIIEFNGNEDLIEFADAKYEDFEIRAKDLAVFSYVNSNLMVVQNSTVGQYKKISKSSCYVATYVYGINSVEVQTLRRFRDEFLLKTLLLSWFVSIYYIVSKKTTILLKDNKNFKRLFHIILSPIILFIRKFYRLKDSK